MIPLRMILFPSGTAVEGRTGVRRIEKATIDKGSRKIEEEKRFRIEK